MNSSRSRFVLLGVLLALTVSLGCGGDDPTSTPPPDGPAPDFALTDVNANSTTSGQAVSPRDYLDGVSAWYFGHAT